MLVITVEVLPGGSAWRRRRIAEMRISNLSNLADVSDYLVQAAEEFNQLTGEAPRSSECLIKSHVRRQSVWKLLQRACTEILNANPVSM
jgi:hypothetical protein